MNTQILGPSAKWLTRWACTNESVGWFGRPADSYASSWGTDSGTRFRRVILVGIFTLIVTAAGLAQSPSKEPPTGELERQLDEMRSQTVKKQNRNAEMEGARGNTEPHSTTDPPTQHGTPPPQDLPPA